MKKIIFKNFLRETTIFFLLSCSSVALIVWVIQAVNYLGFVTEDGHGFKVYFLYTLLSLPKIFNEILPFMFFFSVFFTIVRYEDQNQILIFWSNGIKKRDFLDIILKYSLVFLVLHFLMSVFLVPFAQDKARSFIRQSNIDFLPSLVKPQKFMDSVEKLTMYVDKKNDLGQFENIVIKDTFNNNNSRIIYAKKGFFSQLDNQNFLILNEGKILNINQGKTTVIDFNRTQLNLSDYSSKTTKYPKLQEVNVLLLANCLFQPKDQRGTIMLGDNNEYRFQCSHKKKQLDNFSQEFFSRVFKPLYIPLLAIVSALLLIKSKNSIGYSRFKIKIFIIGIIFISFSEILTKFFSYDLNKSFLLITAPILMSIMLYYLFSKKSLTTSK